MFQTLPEQDKKNWEEKILLQQKSKKSCRSWCRENGESYPAFLYWKRQLFPETIVKRSSFVEITEPPKDRGITLEYQGFRLHLEKQFDASVLKRCLETLKEITC